jgi:hypothetical protein
MADNKVEAVHQSRTSQVGSREEGSASPPDGAVAAPAAQEPGREPTVPAPRSERSSSGLPTKSIPGLYLG